VLSCEILAANWGLIEIRSKCAATSKIRTVKAKPTKHDIYRPDANEAENQREKTKAEKTKCLTEKS